MKADNFKVKSSSDEKFYNEVCDEDVKMYIIMNLKYVDINISVSAQSCCKDCLAKACSCGSCG